MEQRPTAFEEHPHAGYRGRTLRNASADVTFAFAADFSTAGKRLTKRAVLEQGCIYCPIGYGGQRATENAIQAAVAALNRPGKPKVTLNIAGNGLYSLQRFGDQAEVDAYAIDFLRRVLVAPERVAAITLVRSGGQSGFDEAGVKAAGQLGLRTLVLAPKGWTYRTADGRDISDEQAFKQRFLQHLPLEYLRKVTPMSIELFRKGRRPVADLGKVIGNEWGEAVKGIPGYLYEHNLYIEGDGHGQRVLTIANTITKDASLSVLEEKLYEWAVAEGYEFTGAAEPEVATHYTPGEAVSAIRARLDGVWDDPQLEKLGPLMTDSLEDVRRIVEGVSATYAPTSMERMLAEALRSMMDSGGYYDDGDFYIGATEAERANGDIHVVSHGFAAVRVYDEAMGRYGKDKLNPVIPDYSAKAYTYAEVMQRYRELLKDNLGKGLLVDGNMVAVLDPESERIYCGEHLGGPEVVDVRDLLVFSPFEGTVASSDSTIREIENPAFVDLPEGFDQSLRAAHASGASAMASPGLMALSQFEERFKPVDVDMGGGEVTYVRDIVDSIIQAAPNNTIWTLVNTAGVERLCPGFHRVNAEAYIVCEVPWTDPTLEVDYVPGAEADHSLNASQEV